MSTDPRIDLYIARAAPFAQPILTHLRATVRRAVPDAGETIKWGRPFFVHDARILAMMAAFTRHCIFGFWRGEARAPDRGESAGGDYGRITALSDLPADEVLIGQIRNAASRPGDPIAKASRAAPRPLPDMPEDLLAALHAAPAAQSNFDAFPPGARREYLDWILAAKRPETRAGRIAKAIDQLGEGKRLNHAFAR